MAVGTASEGGGDESEIMDEGDVRINEANVYQGTASEGSLANPVIQGMHSTAKDVIEENSVEKLTGPGSGRLRATDGPTKISANNELLGPDLKTSDGPSNVCGNNEIHGFEKQRTWTRRARMDYGLVENLKESVNVVLGKRTNQIHQQVSMDSPEEQAGKRHKSEVTSQLIEAARVSEHPCRAK